MKNEKKVVVIQEEPVRVGNVPSELELQIQPLIKKEESVKPHSEREETNLKPLFATSSEESEKSVEQQQAKQPSDNDEDWETESEEEE